jgi:hypothetical protein
MKVTLAVNGKVAADPSQRHHPWPGLPSKASITRAE